MSRALRALLRFTVFCAHLAVQQVSVRTVNFAWYFLTGYCADHYIVAVLI